MTLTEPLPHSQVVGDPIIIIACTTLTEPMPSPTLRVCILVVLAAYMTLTVIAISRSQEVCYLIVHAAYTTLTESMPCYSYLAWLSQGND